MREGRGCAPGEGRGGAPAARLPARGNGNGRADPAPTGGLPETTWDHPRSAVTPPPSSLHQGPHPLSLFNTPSPCSSHSPLLLYPPFPPNFPCRSPPTPTSPSPISRPRSLSPHHSFPLLSYAPILPQSPAHRRSSPSPPLPRHAPGPSPLLHFSSPLPSHHGCRLVTRPDKQGIDASTSYRRPRAPPYIPAGGRAERPRPALLLAVAPVHP